MTRNGHQAGLTHAGVASDRPRLDRQFRLCPGSPCGPRPPVTANPSGGRLRKRPSPMTQPRVPDTQRHAPRGTSEAQRSVDTKPPGRPGSCEEQVWADPAGAQLGLTRGRLRRLRRPRPHGRHSAQRWKPPAVRAGDSRTRARPARPQTRFPGNREQQAPWRPAPGRAGVARDAPADPGAAGAEAPAGDLLLDRGVGAPATPGPVAAERGRERGRLARHRATDGGRHHPRRTRARHACAGGGVPAGCPQQGRLPPRHGGAPCVFMPLPWGPGGPGACWEGQAADSRSRRMNHHGPRPPAAGVRAPGCSPAPWTWATLPTGHSSAFFSFLLRPTSAFPGHQ